MEGVESTLPICVGLGMNYNDDDDNDGGSGSSDDVFQAVKKALDYFMGHITCNCASGSSSLFFLICHKDNKHYQPFLLLTLLLSIGNY